MPAVESHLARLACPAGDGNASIEATKFASVRLCDLARGRCPTHLDGSGTVDFADIGLMPLDFGPCP